MRFERRDHRGLPLTWIERLDRHGLDLHWALVSLAHSTGATLAELTPRDFSRLCVEAGSYVQYVARDVGVGIRLQTPNGPMTVVSVG